MKKTGLFLLILFMLSACSRVERSYYPNGKMSSELHYRGDDMHGSATWYYETGQEREQFNYSHGKLEGTSRRWRPDGKLESEYSYSEGKKQGIAKMFDSEGRLAIEEHWVNDTLNGPYVEYHANGVLKVEGSFFGGLFDGRWIYRNEAGLEIARADYLQGNGTLRSFYLNGSTERIVPYRNNEKEGLEVWLGQDGDTLRQLMYSEGSLQWER